MSNVQQLSGMRECQIFGRQMLLPIDTAILHAVAGLSHEPSFGTGPKKNTALVYTVGFSLKLTHANLPVRGVSFNPIHGCLFGVQIPFSVSEGKDNRKAFEQLKKEEQKMLAMALQSLSQYLFESFVKGKVSLLELERYFYQLREKLLPTSPQPKARRLKRSSVCTT